MLSTAQSMSAFEEGLVPPRGRAGEGGGRLDGGEVGVCYWIASQSAKTVTIGLHGDLEQDIDHINIDIIDTA